MGDYDMVMNVAADIPAVAAPDIPAVAAPDVAAVAAVVRGHIAVHRNTGDALDVAEPIEERILEQDADRDNNMLDRIVIQDAVVDGTYLDLL